MGALLRILFYIILFTLLAAAVTVVAVAFLHPQDGFDPQTLAANAYQDIRGALGFEGRGRAVGGPPPPTLAERLSAVSTRHIVTPTQEVVMVGGDASTPCLGGDKEMLVEIQNDIGADQLDLSYSIESEGNSNSQEVAVGSCEKDSVIKQCIPVAPQGSGIRLSLRVYHEEEIASDPGKGITVASTTKYPTLLTGKREKIELLASSFA